jgi:hypothetical protein
MTPIKSVWTLFSSIIVHSKVDLFNHMLNSTNWRIWWKENKGNNNITELRTILAYLMKVILRVPNEGYSRNVFCALKLISTFLMVIWVFGEYNYESFSVHLLMTAVQKKMKAGGLAL